jgi:colanic acid biosynthesis glycosyl transferase WcaI
VKILLLNQTFYPDVMATGQYLSKVAVALVERGHEVTVIASRRGYDNPGEQFPAREDWRGMKIYRVASTQFGKGAKWRRAADFASFIVCCCWRLAFLPKQDAVLALTSPPLISFIAAWFTRLRGGRFFYWVMDLNPDEAIAAGWLNPDSFAGKILERMSRFSFRSATKIIALDRFMRDRIAAKGISPDKIKVLPPWSQDEEIHFDAAGRERFRAAHGLQDKFVVMYSGNHSPCHPLDTLLEAARRGQRTEGGGQRAEDRGRRAEGRSQMSEVGGQKSALTSNLRPPTSEIVFSFIGGGSEFKRVQAFKRQHELKNILCLPYQPVEQLSASLSAADLHVVVMGDAFVGIVHPCKIYNILAIGGPVLYIGPKAAHVTEILAALPVDFPRIEARHGEDVFVAEQIEKLRAQSAEVSRQSAIAVSRNHSQSQLLPQLVAEVTANK